MHSRHDECTRGTMNALAALTSQLPKFLLAELTKWLPSQLFNLHADDHSAASSSNSGKTLSTRIGKSLVAFWLKQVTTTLAISWSSSSRLVGTGSEADSQTVAPPSRRSSRCLAIMVWLTARIHACRSIQLSARSVMEEWDPASQSARESA